MKKNIYPSNNLEVLLPAVEEEERTLIFNVLTGESLISVIGFTSKFKRASALDSQRQAILWWDEDYHEELPARQPDEEINENLPFRRHNKYWNLGTTKV